MPVQIKPVLHPDKWDMHDADVGIAACRLGRFSSGDIQILSAYLHANHNPTIEGLAEFTAEIRAEYGPNPRLNDSNEE